MISILRRIRWREVAVPLVVAGAVVVFVGYLWFQGRAHGVAFTVTASQLSYVSAQNPQFPQELTEETEAQQGLVIDVMWEAESAIDGGAYYLLASVPPHWEPLGCEPECEWTTTPDLERYAREVIPVATYPEGAMFSAERAARVRVVFVPKDPDETDPPSFEPAAWLVQTDGDNVLDAYRIQ